MQTEIVSYKDDDLDVKLTVVGPATVEMSMYRTFLANQEEKAARNGKVEGLEGESVPKDLMQISIDFLRTVYYPMFVSAVKDQEGFDHWPISFDEYRRLPEALGDVWEKAVMRLHPEWFKKLNDAGAEITKEEKKEAQKKVTGT